MGREDLLSQCCLAVMGFQLFVCSEGVCKWAWAWKCYVRPRGSPWSSCKVLLFSLYSSLMKIAVKYLRHRRNGIFLLRVEVIQTFFIIEVGQEWLSLDFVKLSVIQILTANRTREKVDSSRWVVSRPICLLPSKIGAKLHPWQNLRVTKSLWSQLESSVTTSWKGINIVHL